jgi:hypothetical protein
MQNNQSSINLAKDKEVSQFDKAIDWTLTVGRLIVIVTEIIAVAAFIYRFSLDGTLVNLHSEIKNKQEVISSLKSEENKYRNLQSRIALAANFSASASKIDQNIMDFVSLIPDSATVNNLIYNKNQINIATDVSSIAVLADFINSLKNSSMVKSISIDNIENKPSVGLSASITVTIK